MGVEEKSRRDGGAGSSDFEEGVGPPPRGDGDALEDDASPLEDTNAIERPMVKGLLLNVPATIRRVLKPEDAISGEL